MTRIFGIIGHPISHSLSPRMHKAVFQALGLEAVYAPFDVPPRDLGLVLRGMSACRIDGLNVTVPHKERIIQALGDSLSLSEEAARLGAVNTLVAQERAFHGHNTDVEGVTRTLTDELRFDPRRRRVLVLGAGGAARAVVWALIRMGVGMVSIANRTRAHAAALCRRFAPHAPLGTLHVLAWQPRAIAQAAAEAELLINATSLGLHAGDPLSAPASVLRRDLAVFDLVYPPTFQARNVAQHAHRRSTLEGGGVYRHPSTRLVQAARQRGALAVDGTAMLVYQGAAAFQLWWERPAPINVMRRAVERAARRTQ